MFNIANGKALLKRFAKNNDGNLAPTFGLSMIFVVATMGAAIDFSELSKARDKSQNIADRTALAAAIFIRDNNRPPETNEEGYVHEHEYSAADLGFQFTEAIQGGPDNVKIRVTYDDSRKEAKVNIDGAVEPKFAQIYGKSSLPFSAETVVSYLQAEESAPASIALVLDASISMQFGDRPLDATGNIRPATIQRIEGLRTTVNRFSTGLKDRLGSFQEDFPTVRMGMYPYNDGQATKGRVDMDFGFITREQLNNIRVGLHTNPAPSMRQVLRVMRWENWRHRRHAIDHGKPVVEPIKFVILMTDGQNRDADNRRRFIPDSSSPFYYRHLGGNSYAGPRNRRIRDFTHQGYYPLENTELTIDACDKMKAIDTQIFTIGYALQVGDYSRFARHDPSLTDTVTSQERANAFDLLQSCASSPDHFVRANDTDALEEAFQTIQNAIVEELIRIKS